VCREWITNYASWYVLVNLVRYTCTVVTLLSVWFWGECGSIEKYMNETILLGTCIAVLKRAVIRNSVNGTTRGWVAMLCLVAVGFCGVKDFVREDGVFVV
jgi:hypothetical protein